jgi:hypothetical protein
LLATPPASRGWFAAPDRSASAGRKPARAGLQQEPKPTGRKTRPAWLSRRECASPLPAPIVLSRSAVRANWDRSLASAGSLRKPPTGGPSPLMTPSAVRRRATSPGAGHAATCQQEREPYPVRKTRGSCTGVSTGRSVHFFAKKLVQAMDDDRCGRWRRSYDSADAPPQIAAAATEPVDDALAWCILLMRAAGWHFTGWSSTTRTGPGQPRPPFVSRISELRCAKTGSG